MVNMNAMPQRGGDAHNTVFRLDNPNIQIQSEELLSNIYDRNKDIYGIPYKEKFQEPIAPLKEETFKRVENVPAQPKLLGKRDKPDVFDESSIAKEATTAQ